MKKFISNILLLSFLVFFSSCSNKVETLTQQGKKLFVEKKYEDAIEKYNAALEIDDKSVEALMGKAEILEYLFKYNEAITCYIKVLNIDADDKKIKELQKKAYGILFARVYRLLDENIVLSMMINSDYSSYWYELFLEGDIREPPPPAYMLKDDFTLIKEKCEKNGYFDKLEANKIEIDKIMKGIQNPPPDYEKAYELLLDLYEMEIEIKKELTDLPTGSFDSYNEKSADFLDNYTKLQNLLEVVIPCAPETETEAK